MAGGGLEEELKRRLKLPEAQGGEGWAEDQGTSLPLPLQLLPTAPGGPQLTTARWWTSSSPGQMGALGTLCGGGHREQPASTLTPPLPGTLWAPTRKHPAHFSAPRRQGGAEEGATVLPSGMTPQPFLGWPQLPPDHLGPPNGLLQLHQPLLVLVPLHEHTGHLYPREAAALGHGDFVLWRERHRSSISPWRPGHTCFLLGCLHRGRVVASRYRWISVPISCRSSGKKRCGGVSARGENPESA